MYRKYGAIILMSNLLFMGAVAGTETAGYRETYSKIEHIGQTESECRVVDYYLLERPEYVISEDEFLLLCKIVEAEAGGEDLQGKLLVANVILNRVESEAFPDTIKEVVFQKNTRAFQFSPAKNSMLYQVSVSEETKDAVERALRGEDNAKGALYFVAPKAVEPDKMRWFDSHLTRLFQYGGHAFFS